MAAVPRPREKSRGNVFPVECLRTVDAIGNRKTRTRKNMRFEGHPNENSERTFTYVGARRVIGTEAPYDPEYFYE